MMWGPGMGYGPMGWMPFIGLFWLIVLVLLISAVVLAFRRPERAHQWPEKSERRSTGLAVLEERYARGEINRDEFLQKKQDIVGG